MSDLIIFGLPPTLEERRERTLAQTLAHLLGEKLARPIEVRIAASYSELADDLADGSLDYAWLPPLEAMSVARHCGAVILAQAERGGEGGYYGVLFVPRGSALKAIAGLKGKPIAFVHRRSTSGYLAVAALLAEAGVATASPPLFCGSHAAAVAAVADKRAVAGATFATFAGRPDRGELLVAGWSQAGGAPVDAYRVLAWAGPIPSDAICAWAGTTRADRAAMQGALTGLHKTKKGAGLLDALFGAQRLDAATAQDFAFLERALQRLAS